MKFSSLFWPFVFWFIIFLFFSTSQISIRNEDDDDVSSLLFNLQHTVSLVMLSDQLDDPEKKDLLFQSGLMNEQGLLTREGEALKFWKNWLKLQPLLLQATKFVSSSEFYRFLSKQPHHEALFAKAMAEFSAYQIPHIVSSGVFQNCRTICDVGGGSGSLLVALKRASHINVRVTLLDASKESLEQAGEEIDEKYEVSMFDVSKMKHLLSKCHCVATKGVISDLQPQEVGSLLDVFEESLSNDSKLFLIDHFISNQDKKSFGRFKQDMNVLMHVLFNARQYREEEMIDMVKKNHQRLEMVSSHATHCPVRIMIFEKKLHNIKNELL